MNTIRVISLMVLLTVSFVDCTGEQKSIRRMIGQTVTIPFKSMLFWKEDEDSFLPGGDICDLKI